MIVAANLRFQASFGAVDSLRITVTGGGKSPERFGGGVSIKKPWASGAEGCGLESCGAAVNVSNSQGYWVRARSGDKSG
jgi:hypothetical protein